MTPLHVSLSQMAYKYECDEWDCTCEEYECDKTGTILRWPSGKSYGFIEEDDSDCDDDLFVHLKGVVSNKRLHLGTRVIYNKWLECNGKYRAVGVRKIKKIHVSKREW